MVRLTDRPDMTKAVDWDVKHLTKRAIKIFKEKNAILLGQLLPVPLDIYNDHLDSILSNREYDQEFHNHKLQINLRQREEETQNIDSPNTIKTALSPFSKMINKLERTPRTTLRKRTSTKPPHTKEATTNNE